MAVNYTLCLVGAMDRLWFHHIILFSEPISLLDTKTIKAAQPISDSITYKHPPSNLSQSSLEDQEETSPSDASQITPPLKDDSSNGEEEKKEIIPQKQERPTRRHNNLTSTTKTRSHSSSPSTQKRCKKLTSMRSYSSSLGRLENTMSCKSLGELELEEVKGFMDLGFTFKKEEISPRMMSVIPGLQRLEDDDIEEEDKRGEILRPYLSEAWLIKRPNSPLLNLRIPRAHAAADMKKHLRFWARTVASEIQQEFLECLVS